MNPGPELDALIAEKVMGIKCPSFISCGRGRGVWETTLPEYSTNISAAWEVVEKMNGHPFDLLALRSPDKDSWSGWAASFKNSADVYGKTAPHAICLAALREAGFNVG